MSEILRKVTSRKFIMAVLGVVALFISRFVIYQE